MRAAEYRDEIVADLVRRFLEEPTSKPPAFSAFLAAYHFHEYLAKQLRKSKRESRRMILDLTPEFHVVQAVATAAKHVRVDDKGAKLVGVTASDAGLGSGAAFDGGTY